jgi:mannose-6-phosphate isomerase-like protein (cupin superfamily)
MRSHRRTFLRASLAASAAAAGFWLAGAAPAEKAPPALLDALYPTGRATVELKMLATRVRLEPGQDTRVIELARDKGTSQHLVAIRKAELPHRHDRHDLLVVMVRGYGSMSIAGQQKPVGEGSILYVPRGAVHAFSNQSPEPAIAFAIYTPPFDGKDRVEVP